jgi:putative transposase
VLLALLYALLRLLIDLLILRGRPTADRDLELLVLRQELLVLRRTAPRRRRRVADRLILAALGRKLSASALRLVQPATILGWHRALVHHRWAAFGRRCGPGRPLLPAECKQLVLRLAKENPLWGYERIRGELLKLGHRVSSTSIRNLLRRHRVPPAPRRGGLSWRRFLQAQGRAILACDYFTVDTVFLKRFYVLFFLELASRRILFTACSEHPGGAWAAQQARNLAWQLQEAEVRPRFLIHDRDSNFPAAFDAVFRAEGLEVIRTPVRAPNANSRCECWVSSLRRECLDWLLIVWPAASEAGPGRVRRALQRAPTSSQPGAATAARTDCDPWSYGQSSGPPDARARADQRVFAAGCLTEHGAAADPDATPRAPNASVEVGTSSTRRSLLGTDGAGYQLSSVPPRRNLCIPRPRINAPHAVEINESKRASMRPPSSPPSAGRLAVRALVVPDDSRRPGAELVRDAKRVAHKVAPDGA